MGVGVGGLGVCGAAHPGVMRFFVIHLIRGLATAQTNMSSTPTITIVTNESKVMHMSPISTMQRASSASRPKRGGIAGGVVGGPHGGLCGGGAGGGGNEGSGGEGGGGGGGGGVTVTCSGVASAVYSSSENGNEVPSLMHALYQPAGKLIGVSIWPSEDT